MKLTLINRNDLEAAELYYEANKPISMEEFRTLLDLQDDQDGFEDHSSEWDVIPWTDAIDGGVIGSEPMTQENLDL